MIALEKRFETFQQNLTEDKIQLENHKLLAFYFHLDRILEINKLQIDCDRKKIGSLFLTEKYKSIFFNILDLVEKIDFNKKINYSNLFNKTIKKIVSEYENNFLTELQKIYGFYYGKQIYSLVYEGTGNDDIKTQGFQTMHDKNIIIIKHFIEIQNESYYSKFFITSNFLDMCLIAFNIAFYHIEKRLSVLNGLLTSTIKSSQSNMV